MKKNIVWLASYPKSGNTWFRVFLSTFLHDSNQPFDINHLPINHIFSSRQIIEDYTGYDISEMTADECDSLRPAAFIQLASQTDETLYIKAHDAFLPLKDNSQLFPIEVTKAAIYFIRNPFDVSVSFSNHLTREIHSTIVKMCDNNFEMAASHYKFNSQVRQKLLSWGQHVNSWLNSSEFPIKFIRYEDMLLNPLKEFSDILNFLNITYTNEKILNVLIQCSFEQLSKFEEQNGFREKPVNCNKFFKTGQKGYYKNFLTEREISILTEAQQEVLITFGYLNSKGEIKI
jgi:hypothetical protein